MYAIRRGHPLKYVERSGIHDPADGEIRADRKGAVRYVMLVSDGLEAPHPYVEVPDDSILIATRPRAKRKRRPRLIGIRHPIRRGHSPTPTPGRCRLWRRQAATTRPGPLPSSS